MKTVAIVGLSNNMDRPSYKVGLYLRNNGFNIIPVNPMISEALGLKAYPSIEAIPGKIVVDVDERFFVDAIHAWRHVRFGIDHEN